ncbi:MAG: PEP-CTERM sorting domain-containing protein [Isosphaeraceae bacterium]
MNRILLLALLSLVLTFCPAADLMSASITYNLQSYPTQQSGLTLSGTITTDGAIGTSLSSADITNWDIIISGAAGYPLTTANSSANLLGGFTTTALGQIEFAKPTTNTNTGIVFESVTTLAFIEWVRSPSSNGDLYEAGAGTGSSLWETPNPGTALGGDPWVIAQAQSVPEPGSLTLALLGSACLAVVHWTRRCSRAVCRPQASSTAHS